MRIVVLPGAGRPLTGCGSWAFRTAVPGMRIVDPSVGAELFEDLGDVGGERRLRDVVGVGDLLAGVPE